MIGTDHFLISISHNCVLRIQLNTFLVPPENIIKKISFLFFKNISSISYYWRREQQSIQVFLPGESHGQRSLAGYSPWGRKESDMTE